MRKEPTECHGGNRGECVGHDFGVEHQGFHVVHAERLPQ